MDFRYVWIRGARPTRQEFPKAKSRPFMSGSSILVVGGQILVYSFGFLCLAARSQHDVVPTLGGGVVLAADRVAVDVGSRAHG